MARYRSSARVGIVGGTLSLVVLTSGIVLAQAGFRERTIPPSGVVEAPSELTGQPRPRVTAEPSAAPTASATSRKAFTIPYTIRPGDTLGTVAQMFGISADDLARANRLHPDDELLVDEVLKVPNPFTAEVNGLKAQLDSLNADAQAARQKAEAAENLTASLKERVQELTGDNQTLNHSLKILPWWRGTALSLAAAAVLMFGVMVVTLFEWWRMRRKFVALAEMTDSLGHLDYKYKSMLAKAELRLQQLYGRRRQGITEGQPRPKLPEELEIDRLNQELREVLERNLERLGARPRSSKSRWREVMGGSVNPAAEPEARTTRR